MNTFIKRKIKLSAICIILLFTAANAQENSNVHQNNIYIELLGNGIIWSVNYERMIFSNSIIKVGLGYIPKMENDFISAPQSILIPIDYIHLIDMNDNAKIDIGIGLTFKFGEEEYGDKDEIIPNAILGYRYQPNINGFMFRISFSPYISENRFFPWIGISFGQKF